MNCRERTLTALDHKEPDLVPIDFGGRHTTLHLYAHELLMRHLGLSGQKPHIRSYHTYLVEPDAQLLQRFERVTALLFPRAPSDNIFHIDSSTNTYVDKWGTTFYMPPRWLLLRHRCRATPKCRDRGGSQKISLAKSSGSCAHREADRAGQGCLCRCRKKYS